MKPNRVVDFSLRLERICALFKGEITPKEMVMVLRNKINDIERV